MAADSLNDGIPQPSQFAVEPGILATGPILSGPSTLAPLFFAQAKSPSGGTGATAGGSSPDYWVVKRRRYENPSALMQIPRFVRLSLTGHSGDAAAWIVSAKGKRNVTNTLA